MNPTKLWLPLLILLTLTLAHAEDVRSGDDVLRAMHDRYAKSWYETLTFTQQSTTYNPDGTSKVDTWHEAAALPGKLRIDIGPASNGNDSFWSMEPSRYSGRASRRELAPW